MKNYPEIYRTVFGDESDPVFTSRDACINSDLLRCACDDFLRIIVKNGEFTAETDWVVQIIDQHDNEDEPHYVLAFGENGEDLLGDEACFTYKVRYCDNYSKAERNIDQNPGTYTITNWIKKDRTIAISLAKRISIAYIESLKKHFPDYYIICRHITT